MYLNRLSDWLFVAARTTNASEAVSDSEWHAKEKN
jgi:cob(I)alamin adenosyltransferase